MELSLKLKQDGFSEVFKTGRNGINKLTAPHPPAQPFGLAVSKVPTCSGV